MNQAIVIFYDGSELTEYAITRIIGIIQDFRKEGSSDIDVNCLTPEDLVSIAAVCASMKRKSSKKTAVVEKPDTSVGDAALIYVAEKFQSVWNDKTQLLIQMSRAVGQNADRNLIKSLQVLNDPAHPFQKEIGRDYHYGDMQKYVVETIYSTM